MTQSANHLEANIKREITRAYKNSFGKGPEETSVKVFSNVVFIKFDGGLTLMEQNLMALDRGRMLVRQIRDLLLKHNEDCVSAIENIVNSKLEESGYVFGKKDNAVYLTMVFDKEIEIH